MIRRLRRRFIAVFMALTALVLAGTFGFYYLSSVASLRQESENTLMRLAEQNTVTLRLPWDTGEEVTLPYFTIEAWRTGRISALMDQYYDLSGEDLGRIVMACLARKEDAGVLEEMNLRYARRETVQGWRIVCADMSFERQVQRNLVQGSLVAGLLALGGFFLLSLFLSRWMVRPVERAWKQQRQFVSDASHELRTPLTVILSNAEMLQSRPGEEDSRLRWLENIRAEGERMRALVEDLLCLARLEEGGRTGDRQPVDLSELAARAALTFEPAAYERGVALSARVTSGCLAAGESGRLSQLLSILLDNGVKYCRGAGPVVLTVEREAPRHILLRVENPGPEIPAEQQKHLFDRFYRADPSRGEAQGYGLGLSIAKEIVEQAGGKIWVSCGGGLVTFSVRLPEWKQRGTPQ